MAARQLHDIYPNIIFAHMDGVTWASYLNRNYGVSSLPLLIVVDPANKSFWEKSADVEMTSVGMRRFIVDVISGRVEVRVFGHVVGANVE